MEICYFPNCRRKADFYCSCNKNIFICPMHITNHQGVGHHSMQPLYLQIDQKIREKAVKVLSSTIKCLEDAISIAKNRSEELIERINLSLGTTLTALYTQREYYDDLLNKCCSPRGVSKNEYKNLWRTLNILGSRDLWKITDFTGDVLVNPMLVEMNGFLFELSKEMNKTVEQRIVQRATADFVYREMIEFIANFKKYNFESVIKNSNKICNKLKSPECLKLPLACPKVFKLNYNKFSGLGIMFNFKEEVKSDLTVSPAVVSFLHMDFTKIVVKTAQNFSKLKSLLPEILSKNKLSDMTDFLNNISTVFKFSNKELVKMIIEKYEFKQYCSLIKQFFFFGQGDFFYLMFEELFIHMRLKDLDSLLEECYWKSNARKISENLFKVLSIKIDEKFLELEWEGYQLDIDLKYPLSLFISKESLVCLQKSFSFMWQLRRVDFVLKQISYKRKILSFRIQDGVRSLLHKMNILRFRLTSFINASIFFFMEEVIEVAWKRFLSLVDDSEDLEDLDIAVKDLVKYVQIYNFMNSKVLYETFYNILRMISKFVDIQHEVESSIEADDGKDCSEQLRRLNSIRDGFDLELNRFKTELNLSQNKLFYYFHIKLSEL